MLLHQTLQPSFSRSLLDAHSKQYLPQFESRGRTWQSLLTDGKIPKTDADIQKVFGECDRMTAEIKQKIEDIRNTYQELDEMVNKLYRV